MLHPLRIFGFVLKDASQLYVERFEQRAGALDLTLPQCKALVYLANHEGISQAQLGGADGSRADDFGANP